MIELDSFSYLLVWLIQVLHAVLYDIILSRSYNTFYAIKAQEYTLCPALSLFPRAMPSRSWFALNLNIFILRVMPQLLLGLLFFSRASRDTIALNGFAIIFRASRDTFSLLGFAIIFALRAMPPQPSGLL